MSPIEFNRFAQIGAEFEEKAALVVERTALRIETRAKANAPVRADNTAVMNNAAMPVIPAGHLRDSIQVGEGTGPLSKRINVGAEYGAPVEFGSSAHDVFIKNAWVLTDGLTFFGPMVHIPAQPPRPFLAPAVEAEGPGFYAALESVARGVKE